MKQRKRMKFAFSLIELSIVIVVIGLLILGITKGTRIMYQAKLKSARALTASSPVNSIPDLLAWYETTLESSFISSEAVDGNNVSVWYDNNQSSTKYNLSSDGNAASTHVTYVASAINGLPALSFSGSNNNYLYTNILMPATNYSIYVVFNQTTTSNSDLTSFQGPMNSSGILVEINNGSIRFLNRINDGTSNDQILYSSYSPKKANVLSYVRSANRGYSIIKVNGVRKDSSDILATISGSICCPTTLNVGAVYAGNRYYIGYISEIIIFARDLNTTENNEVENYLMKKWGVRSS